MSAKTIANKGLTNELEGASLYFTSPAKYDTEQPSAEQAPGVSNAQPVESLEQHDMLGQPASLHTSRQAGMHDSRHASNPAITRDSRIAGKHDRKHESTQAVMPASQPATTPARKPESIHESTQAVSQASRRESHPAGIEPRRSGTQDDLIEAVRKSVKQVGKELLSVRLTPAEKDELRSVVQDVNELYRWSGRKTSENEVNRIALKFILEDYRQNGERSVLAILQAALNA